MIPMQLVEHSSIPLPFPSNLRFPLNKCCQHSSLYYEARLLKKDILVVNHGKFVFRQKFRTLIIVLKSGFPQRGEFSSHEGLVVEMMSYRSPLFQESGGTTCLEETMLK